MELKTEGENFSPIESSRVRGRGRGRGGRGSAQDREVALVIDKSVRVFINNIPSSLIDAQQGNALRDRCEAFGEVDRYTLFTDSTGRYTGSAMCTFVSADSAKLAVETMNHSTVDGAMLEVSFAKNHGVHLLDPKFQKKIRPGIEDTWKNDKFDPDAKPKPLNLDNRGGRGRGRGGDRGRGGRGRGGHHLNNAPMTQEELDAELAQYNAPAPAAPMAGQTISMDE